jgi:hypothetical protein
VPPGPPEEASCANLSEVLSRLALRAQQHFQDQIRLNFPDRHPAR